MTLLGVPYPDRYDLDVPYPPEPPPVRCGDCGRMTEEGSPCECSEPPEEDYER